MDRVTADARIGSYSLVNLFLLQLFSDDLQDSFQLISRFRLWLEFTVIFQHGTPDMIVQKH